MPDPSQLLPYGQMAQGGQPPQQPQGGGLLDSISQILSHPAVQGLLGAYFGAVSSPRQMGVGGAIGRGGLEGLGMANQAQLLRSKIPLQQAELERARAQIPEAQARTRYLNAQAPLADARTQSLQPIGPEAAGRIIQQNPELGKVVSPDNLATQTWGQVNQLFNEFQKRQQNDPRIKAQTEAAGATAALRKGQLGALPSLEAQRAAQTNALNKGIALMPTSMPGVAPMPATSVAPAEPTAEPGAPPPEAAGEATHEQDFVGPDGKKVTMRLIGGKWQPAT
jgi:hypothetical protein